MYFFHTQEPSSPSSKHQQQRIHAGIAHRAASQERNIFGIFGLPETTNERVLSTRDASESLPSTNIELNDG